MAIPKVFGTETEYGIAAAGAPDFNPVLSSSLLISTYAGSLRRIRWDYEQESPLRDARGFEPVPAREGSRRGPRTRERDPAQRRPLLRRPRAPGVLHARMHHASRAGDPRQGGGAHPGAIAGRGAHVHAQRAAAVDLQEQLRRQGQLLRHARELPDGPLAAVRRHRARPHAVLRHADRVHGRRQGGRRGAVGRARAFDLPTDPARRLLRDRGRARDHAEAAHHQHARRTARRSRGLPAAPRDRGRREHVRGLHVPEDRHHGDRAQDDRGPRAAGPVDREPGPGAARGLPRRHLHARGHA